MPGSRRFFYSTIQLEYYGVFPSSAGEYNFLFLFFLCNLFHNIIILGHKHRIFILWGISIGKESHWIYYTRNRLDLKENKQLIHIEVHTHVFVTGNRSNKS